MPRTLKRRSDAISRDESEAPSETPQPVQARKQRRTSPSVSGDDRAQDEDVSNAGSDNENDPRTQQSVHVKKLVRLALAAEYSRQPIRRTDINAKILNDGSTKARDSFKTIFNAAQAQLRNVFGMELVDLPQRERAGLNDRRKAAGQRATQKEIQASQRAKKGEDVETQKMKDTSTAVQAWILVSVLPEEYRQDPNLLAPQRTPSSSTEATYAALCAIVVSLIYLHAPSGHSESHESNAQVQAREEDTTEPITDAKLIRFLSRMHLDSWVPQHSIITQGGTTIEKLLARMMKEGYIEKRRDNTSGEELIEWVVGPRGKREIGRKGIAGLVRQVYGFGPAGDGLQAGQEDVESQPDADVEDDGDEARVRSKKVPKIERGELESRLKRTLGETIAVG